MKNESKQSDDLLERPAGRCHYCGAIYSRMEWDTIDRCSRCGRTDHLIDTPEFEAAPELLEALKNARIALAQYRHEMDCDNPGKNKTYPFGIDCENAARAAIAKAEGR